MEFSRLHDGRDARGASDHKERFHSEPGVCTARQGCLESSVEVLKRTGLPVTAHRAHKWSDEEEEEERDAQKTLRSARVRVAPINANLFLLRWILSDRGRSAQEEDEAGLKFIKISFISGLRGGGEPLIHHFCGTRDLDPLFIARVWRMRATLSPLSKATS